MTEIARLLDEALSRGGAISFARFMELALYAPQVGYYEQDKPRIGRQGDFRTSVSTGPLFGELLAWQLAAWLGELGQGRVQLVEAGAHDGTLAGDILGWLRLARPELFGRLEYWIVEPSGSRRGWQRRRLEDFAGRVRWVDRVEGGLGSVRGVVFCNELLDAMPVRRLGWDASSRHWFEWGVGRRDGQLGWVRLEVEQPGMEGVLREAGFEIGPELRQVLPDGFTIDLCPGAGAWWGQAARSLAAGWLLAIDYGFSADEMLSPARQGGTLRAYWRHRLHSDVLACPGEQDLTAHVNFSQLRLAGELAGVRTEGCWSQEEFLTGIVRRMWGQGAEVGGWEGGCWRPDQVRQFQTLIHPDQFGRCFRVFVQSRGCGSGAESS